MLANIAIKQTLQLVLEVTTCFVFELSRHEINKKHIIRLTKKRSSITTLPTFYRPKNNSSILVVNYTNMRRHNFTCIKLWLRKNCTFTFFFHYTSFK